MSQNDAKWTSMLAEPIYKLQSELYCTKICILITYRRPCNSCTNMTVMYSRQQCKLMADKLTVMRNFS